MGQVAFDALQASEELESAGISREQARAISLVVRRSHEVADVATKRDLEDVRKDMVARFEKNEAQIADIRKDLSAEIADVRKDLSAEMNLRFEKTDGQIALIRKDVETIATGLLLKLGGVIVVTISAATAILKFF
ncbi:hypothetical protein [Arsenophonus endosymbiont of Crataerina pallida]|uniref:hypothetical protein n=1 Tax=Arsenophonus endosymbiont of Crataerina pallida TaxID=3066235 RepID=UPI0030CAB5FB